MSNPLSPEQIAALLGTTPTANRGPRKSKNSTAALAIKYARPVQVGPLGWGSEAKPCTARRCGSSTLVRFRGAPMCAVHALYSLNRLLVNPEIDLSQCDCSAGLHSNGNLHTEGCPVYEQVKNMELS